jgi:hypothetical protein
MGEGVKPRVSHLIVHGEHEDIVKIALHERLQLRSAFAVNMTFFARL